MRIAVYFRRLFRAGSAWCGGITQRCCACIPVIRHALGIGVVLTGGFSSCAVAVAQERGVYASMDWAALIERADDLQASGEYEAARTFYEAGLESLYAEAYDLLAPNDSTQDVFGETVPKHVALERYGSRLQWLSGTVRDGGAYRPHARLGETYARLAELHFDEFADVPRAVAYYDSAGFAINAALQTEDLPSDRLARSETYTRVFEQWVLALHAYDRAVGGSYDLALAALAVAERGRHQVHQDYIGNALSEQQYGSVYIPQRFGDQLGAKVLAQEANNLLRSIRGVSAGVLVYYVTDQRLFYWMYSEQDGLWKGDAPIARDTLQRLVATAHTMLEEQQPSEAARKALAYALLPSTLQELTVDELVIVPHEQLNRVSFAALPFGSEETLLLDRFAIRYAPSLATLSRLETARYFNTVEHAQQEMAAGSLGISPEASNDEKMSAFERTVAERFEMGYLKPGPVLIVGDPDMPFLSTWTDGTPLSRPVKLSKLDRARAEVEWIAARLEGDALSGEAATESEIRRRMTTASLVHFATHAMAYETHDRAMDSFVALAPDDVHDGLLTMREVLEEIPPLDGPFVVLSACDTGGGDVRSAEGTLGLQWAFFARGALNLMMTTWSVGDDVAATLMQRFYAHWLGDEPVTKAEALKRAQVDVRGMSRFGGTFDWAAYQLAGAR